MRLGCPNAYVPLLFLLLCVVSVRRRWRPGSCVHAATLIYTAGYNRIISCEFHLFLYVLVMSKFRGRRHVALVLHSSSGRMYE